MDNKRYAVAIDGPSGAGKSTLAKAAAAELGILYVDTGAIYRTIGLYACRRETDPHDLAAIIALLPDIQVSMAYGEDGLQHMLLNGEDVTDVIRRPEISRWASVVSAIPEVRAFLLEMQRELARSHSVVMDGRDIGTVVLPQAEVKIFLTASPEIRAQRRMKELEQRGTPQPYNQVLSDILQRDWADSHRETAPLRQAEDALLLDTSHLDFEEYVTPEMSPFDLSDGHLDVPDDDYGVWYVDMMDNPDRYDGVTVRYKAVMCHSKKFKGVHCPGRFAMVCCENDMQFLALVAKGEGLERFKNRQWVEITATVKKEANDAYQGEGPVLYVTAIAPCEKPKEEVVSF